MAVRPIDGDELLDITRLLETDEVRQSRTASWLLDQVLHDIQAMPTLTPPNEPLTCEGCDMQGEKVTPCASCIRDPRVCDYYTRRLPERQEDNNDGD